MTCKELIRFLDDYLDGTLSPAQRDVFEQHLAACIDCTNYLRSYRITLALGKAAYRTENDQTLPADVPDDLIQAILAARTAHGSP